MFQFLQKNLYKLHIVKKSTFAQFRKPVIQLAQVKSRNSNPLFNILTTGAISFIFYKAITEKKIIKNSDLATSSLIEALLENLNEIIAKQGEDCQDAAKIYYNLGFAMASEGNYTKSLEYYEKALSIISKTYGKKSTDYATALGNVSIIYILAGQNGKAIEGIKESLELKKFFYGSSNLEVAMAYSDLSAAYAKANDNKSALENVKISFDMLKELQGEKADSTLYSLVNMGIITAKLGNKKEGLQILEDASKKLTEKHGSDHPWAKMVKVEINKLK